MLRLRETLAFGAVLAGLIAGFLSDSLFGGLILSPGDVAYADPAFSDLKEPGYEPKNRLLMDPVLQFHPWLEFSRSSLRSGRLPVWNPYAGCGAPLLANGQSAVFDPFHGIAYLGTLPEAYAWMAAARLWVAGMGMFWLARMWTYGPWGRWFCGLAYPFCGFLVVWLQYPVTSVAVWMPWLMASVEGAARRPSMGRTALLGLSVCLVLLGGHVQTSAHVLLSGLLYVIWRWRGMARRSGWAMVAGLLLGIGMAAVEVMPLAAYLSRSPVWTDRNESRAGLFSLETPRVLDSTCTAFPYLYGSQRRGHPNLAKPLGVHNLNESAGGFAGLATLIWLAPVGASRWRKRRVAGFLIGLTSVGALAAFSVPPVPNLLGLVPVLNVMDHRRLSLWIAFGLVALGGLGLDWIGRASVGRRWVIWERLWQVGAMGMLAGALAIPVMMPMIRPKVEAHYEQAGASVPGSVLADRQMGNLGSFTPLYLGQGAVQLLALAGLSASVRGGRFASNRARGLLVVVVLVDLFAFGRGLNPAIARRDDRPEGPVIARLRQVAPGLSRILPIGDVLPPNRLMSYGLCDVRNYDSIELSRSLDTFEALYEAEPGSQARHSRRTISWEGVRRSVDVLRAAGVSVVVGPTRPPDDFDRRERIGNVWLAFLDPSTSRLERFDHGGISLKVEADEPRPVRVAVTNDPGWVAEIDGRSEMCLNPESAFLELNLPPGSHRVNLRYEPREVRLAIGISVASAVAWLLVIAVSRVGDWPEKTVEGLGAFGGVTLESNP